MVLDIPAASSDASISWSNPLPTSRLRRRCARVLCSADNRTKVIAASGMAFSIHSLARAAENHRWSFVFFGPVSLRCRPAGPALGPGHGPDLERASDQLVIVERGAVSADGGSFCESSDGANPLHIAERLTDPRPHRSIDGRISTPRVRLREEELQSVGGDRGCVGEQARLVDGTEDCCAVAGPERNRP